MKKRFLALILTLVLLAAALSGCKLEHPDDVAAPEQLAGEQVPLAGGADEATGAGSLPGETGDSESEADDGFYDVDDGLFAGMDPAEYQKYVDAANTRTVDELQEKDQYGTDPTPEGMPKPIDWNSGNIDTSVAYSCTLYVECALILNNIDKFNMDKLEVLPEDGQIYAAKTVTFYKGESVFDMLLREMQNSRIHMEFINTPGYGSAYIQGIHNIYEKDCGETSGWMYCVNGWYPNYGVSRYALKNGDKVELHYTCDLGRDLGVTWVDQK